MGGDPMPLRERFYPGTEWDLHGEAVTVFTEIELDADGEYYVHVYPTGQNILNTVKRVNLSDLT